MYRGGVRRVAYRAADSLRGAPRDERFQSAANRRGCVPAAEFLSPQRHGAGEVDAVFSGYDGDLFEGMIPKTKIFLFECLSGSVRPPTAY